MERRRRLRLLLDTHALIWFLNGHPSISRRARASIELDANEVFVSAVSAMEITTKYRSGKLPEAAAYADRLEIVVRESEFSTLPMTFSHGQLAGALAFPHKDPFDRLLLAQAMADDLVLVSNEAVFDSFGVRRLW